MKKINYDQYDKGQEISGVTFQQHQNQVIESLNSVMLSLGLNTSQMTVLWGLKNTGSGNNYNISQGAVFYDGEIFEVDAFMGTATLDQVPFLRAIDVPVGDDIRFADGTILPVHIDSKYEVVLGTPSTGEFDLNAAPRLPSVLNTTIGANDYTDDEIDELKGTSTTYTDLGLVETAIEELQSSERFIQSATSKPMGSYVDNALQQINSLTYIIFSAPSARIQPSQLEIPENGSRAIRLFASFRFAKHNDSRNFSVSIMVREGTGSWQLVRERKFWSHDTSHATMMGVMEIDTLPTSYLEFCLRVEPENDPIRISTSEDIEFEAIF